MTDILVSKYGAVNGIFKDIFVSGLPLEYWRMEKIHFSELREPMVVLFLKCKSQNEYGGCTEEELLTIGYFENAYCETVQSNILDESEWFCVLGNYPVDNREKDIILQAFAMHNNRLKYQIRDPYGSGESGK